MDDFINTIGADEVGVGDYFGGIVTCAVFLDEQICSEIIDLPIKDSKKLSISTTIKLAKTLIKKVIYEVCVVSPKQYNFLYSKFHNSHVIKTYAHNEAIYHLQQKLNKNLQYVTILDQYANKTHYDSYLNTLNPKYIAKIDIFTPKAESKYLAVACASIIARYYFLKQIKDLSLQVGVILPLGFNQQAIDEAINQLHTKYESNWNEMAYDTLKIHFKYTNQTTKEGKTNDEKSI